MTDEEIIKALECCGNITGGSCNDCPMNFVTFCAERVRDAALDLINQQKAEIERLTKHKEYAYCNLLGNCLVYSKNLKDYNDMRKGLKSEARQELVRRISKSIGFCDLPNGVVRSHIDKVMNELEK